jgi:hypothetical protein
MHLCETVPRPVGLYSLHSPEFPPDRSNTGFRQLPADLHRPFPLSISSLVPALPPPNSYIAGSLRLADSSAATCSRWFFDRGFFYPEDGGDTILRNVGSIDHIYTAPYPRIRHSLLLLCSFSWLPLHLWERNLNCITNRTFIIRSFYSQVCIVKDCRDAFIYKWICAF